jgi:hypothetical protein
MRHHSNDNLYLLESLEFQHDICLKLPEHLHCTVEVVVRLSLPTNKIELGELVHTALSSVGIPEQKEN